MENLKCLWEERTGVSSDVRDLPLRQRTRSGCTKKDLQEGRKSNMSIKGE